MYKNSVSKTNLFIALMFWLSGCQHNNQQFPIETQQVFNANLSCVEYADVRRLSGSSLSPAFLSGDLLLFLGGYYGCNPVKYGDLVLYRWGDHKNVTNLCAVYQAIYWPFGKIPLINGDLS
jgi:hypothetical protein